MWSQASHRRQILQVGQLTCSAGTLNVNGSVALTSGALSSHTQVNVSGQIYAATGAISVTPDSELKPDPDPASGIAGESGAGDRTRP